MVTQGRRPCVLIANRGEIACRVIKTCNHLSIDTLAVYTDPDALAPHVKLATRAVCLGPNPRQYTNGAKLLEVAIENHVTAVHPGYGFLSENEEFATAIEAANIQWLGPDAKTIHDFALKHVARELAKSAGVPVLEGSGLVTDVKAAVVAAESIGYPVLLKATGGGGGRGIYMCFCAEDVETQFDTSRKQGEAFFGNSGVFVEKYIEKAHHIEVQMFGDGKGGAVGLGERECSIQRRHQKVLEETPSPLIATNEALRSSLVGAAVSLAKAAKYRSAGTVEFLVDEGSGKFYFLEVNTRLQVEHGITELVHGGVDLVEWMLRLQVPGLEPLVLEDLKLKSSGHSIEVRLNGEDPAKDFRPSPGILGEVSFPEESDSVRVDTWVSAGTEISPYYDSLLGKLMVFAPTRKEAIEKMQVALAQTSLKGVPNNVEFLAQLVHDPRFIAGDTPTSFLNTFYFSPHVMEVIQPGLQTSVQDWPGRIKLWHVGVPPSGPMDSLSFRLANALVGNESNAAGLEFSLMGPTLKFHCDCLVALCGARFEVSLVDSEEQDQGPVSWWSSFEVKAGQKLCLGNVDTSTGVRGYLAVAGGIDVPVYLGSRATFPSGNFGGYQGRYLRPGDSLPLTVLDEGAPRGKPTTLPEGWKDQYGGAVSEAVAAATAKAKGIAPEEVCVVGVLPGPHANPDYLTDEAIEVFYSVPYKVHYNSNRLGVRLNGPRPTWTRADGGEGGSHPSNVHDHVYAIGTVNFTGDMPVILTVDGPSLGGFVCPTTIISSELWKIGQVRPNDGILFKPLTIEEAYQACLRADKLLEVVRDLARGAITVGNGGEALSAFQVEPLSNVPETKPLLLKVEPHGDHPGAEYRLAGDRYVQVEYGPMELDLNLRVRVHALEQWLAANNVPGLVETNPGVRSCMVEYDQRLLPLPQLLELLKKADAALPHVQDLKLPSRIVHLPMAFDERWTHEALAKYTKSFRSEAPYLPSNIDYIAANNGLEGGRAEVADIIFNASYLVLGLGDVYLGAPCAVPLDPRHRLVTAKMNPARTFTHEGTVGIGGCYMCIYPMDSPGGYQLVGRTLPIWNTFARSGPFTPDAPWLLRFFDQVRFHHVSEDELEVLRKEFKNGECDIKIEETEFSMAQYNSLVESCKEEVVALKVRQRAAMEVQLQKEEESLARLEAAKAAQGAGDMPVDDEDESIYDHPSFVKITSSFTASVWDIKVKPGQQVVKDEVMMILEAMKMESPLHAPVDGVVKAIKAEQSSLAQAGSLLIVLEKTSTE